MTEQLLSFEILMLSDCLLPGQYTFKEGKASINVTPEPGETILIFNIDDRSNPNCKLRQFLWGNEKSQKMCDLLVFYAKGEQRVICFVELKDDLNHIGDAVEQVINTYNKLKLSIKSRYTAKAFISSYSGSLPNEHQRYRDKLRQVFHQDHFIYDGKSNELGDFLRGLIPKLGKGKKTEKK